MGATQLGTDLMVGVGTTMASYVVSKIETLDNDVKTADVFDEDGALKTRIVFYAHARTRLELVCLISAAPATDFVKGSICAVAPLSNFYVEDVTLGRTEGAATVTVTGINIGIT